MISLETAVRLKQAGLQWIPAKFDFFALPDRDMDTLVFVISDMSINVELFAGNPVVTFNGAPEWALDYVTIREVVWLPREEQLRTMLEDRLRYYSDVRYQLVITPNIYVCELEYNGVQHSFGAADASEAYAKALLYLMATDHDKFPRDERIN
jgi:hypothetical protein